MVMVMVMMMMMKMMMVLMMMMMMVLMMKHQVVRGVEKLPSIDHDWHRCKHRQCQITRDVWGRLLYPRKILLTCPWTLATKQRATRSYRHLDRVSGGRLQGGHGMQEEMIEDQENLTILDGMKRRKLLGDEGVVGLESLQGRLELA